LQKTGKKEVVMSELDSFSYRGGSYKKGIQLLIDNLTEKEWKFDAISPASRELVAHKIKEPHQNYLRELSEATAFEARENHLSALLAAYSQILSQYTTLSNCFQSLCMAERYAVWKEGRQAFTSKFNLDTPQKNTQPLNIAQHEAPFTDDKLLLEEFSDLANRAWFRLLPSWQQVFIEKNKDSLVKQSIPSSLRCVPGLANLSEHRCAINGVEFLSYFRHATQLPVDLLKKKGAEAEAFRLGCLNVASQVRLSLDRQFKRAQPENSYEAVILSQSILSPGLAADAKSTFFTDPSDNDTQMYEVKEQVIELFQQAIANPNKAMTSKDASKVKAFFTHDEATKTLYYRDFLTKFDLQVPPDSAFECSEKDFKYLDADLECPKYPDGVFIYKSYQPIKITLLSTNHPFNILRRLGIHSTQTKRNALNTTELLAAVARYLEPQLSRIEKNCNQSIKSEFHVAKKNVLDDFAVFREDTKISTKAKGIFIERLQTLQNIIEIQDVMHLISRNSGFNKSDENIIRLLDAVQALLSILAGQGVLESDGRHHQQLISAAEATILHCIGGTLWVACKSGKDRTGGASAAYDAAAAFYKRRGRQPRYDDNESDRALYLSLLAKCYESGHQQNFAAESAPGAKGLLGASLFLPGDMRLDAQKVKQETQLARLNKPKRVKEKPLDTFNKQLLEAELQKLKDEIINHRLGDSTTWKDWPRNVNNYFIDGICVNHLLENKKFENKEALSRFIGNKLLHSIEDQELKKYYQALILYSFHQGGFPHVNAMVNNKLIKQFHEQTTCLLAGQDVKVNFSYSGNAIHIKETNTYSQIKNSGSGEILFENDGYCCQTHSSISVALRKAKGKGYQLATAINNVNVDLAYGGEQLKPLFFKNPSLFERIINFFVSLNQAIKQYFHRLDENWLSKVNNPKAEGSNVQASNGVISAPPQLLLTVERVSSLSSTTSTEMDTPSSRSSPFFPKFSACDFNASKKENQLGRREIAPPSASSI
jgi:hypothetical protein